MSMALPESVSLPDPVVRLTGVGLSHGKIRALNDLTFDLPAGRMVGLIGPDGVGKSSLLSLISGAHVVGEGRVEVLGGDIADATFRRQVCSRIAYMPQGLGKNLYPTLSVFDNIDFFGRLFGQNRAERERRIGELLESTGLSAFATRPAGKLSGGMKQKLGLCCALIHDPDLLILDEPTTGVDPLSRRQFWELIETIRARRAGMSVIVATAAMDEASRFDWLVAMDAGAVLATGTPGELLAKTGEPDLDAAFIALLPEARRAGHVPLVIPPRRGDAKAEIAIEAEHLTMRFGDFTAVDDVGFRIEAGEIFGFLGSNGCGKTTTMKMLTGLLAPTEGKARLFGRDVDPHDIAVRRRIGYMSQGFSLYSELTVRQNLDLHAHLFGIADDKIAGRIDAMAQRFDLTDIMEALPDDLPLGIRQRMSLAVAMIHAPAILILDEPTSGVDPIARDQFWQILSDLSRLDKVTIFVSTHFMNEAALCDRISLMHAGKVLVTDTPAAIVAGRSATTLEDAFISYLEEAIGEDAAVAPPSAAPARPAAQNSNAQRPLPAPPKRYFDPRRMLAYSRRETVELIRDPIRATLALLGSVILMFVIGYGINLDVENLSFAVLDRDDTTISRDYVLQLSGSRYFSEEAPIEGYADLDRRMRSGKLSLAIEIPAGFGRDISRGRQTEIAAWIDGGMPTRAETVRGYVQGMHAAWLSQKSRELTRDAAAPSFDLDVRYRYNPDLKSVVAMAPAVIPLLLMMIPAMLAALSIVREKELGSIINFYVTPVTRLEFMLGKQLPYIALAMVNALTLTAAAIFVFKVPFTGSLFTFWTGAFLFVTTATAIGLLLSTVMGSQIAAIFGTALVTIVPGTQYSGMIDPVSSLQGVGVIIGDIYPGTYFNTIARGTFSKALGFADLSGAFLPLVVAIPVLLGAAVLLLRKQAH